MTTKPQSLPRRMATTPATPFGTFVRDRRLKMGLTQKTLAELTGFSLTLVRSVEQGGTNFHLAKLQKLLEALGGELTVVERAIPESFDLPADDEERP